MIANRSRLEKQIFLGRQAVRRSLASKDKLRASMSPDDKTTPGETINYTRLEPSGFTRSSAPPSPRPTPSDTTETPFPADTDAEVRWLSKRGQVSASPNHSRPSTPHDKEHDLPDPLCSPVARRKWVSNLLKGDNLSSGFFHSPTADPPPDNSVALKQVHQSSSTSHNFFKRLRTTSFPSLSSPFSSVHLSKRSTGGLNEDTVAQQGWSSDSSDDDDVVLVDDRRHIRHPSVLNFVYRRHSQDHLNDEEDSKGEQEYDTGTD
jgi:hypothetical protein